jgi:ectoine hydroxylase-related dioxygenase (phytanoyl-CoA dioxygenase family)
MNEVSSFGMDHQQLLHRSAIAQRRDLRMGSSPMDDIKHDQQRKLIQRGELEASIMAGMESPILLRQQPYAESLRTEGVVRIDRVLPDHLADAMHTYVSSLRDRSNEAIKNGDAIHSDRFANVLLHTNRCDLKIPLGPSQVQETLRSILLKSPVRNVFETLLGPNATLYELSCLISDPGSQRQNVHPDHPCLHNDHPLVVTCFVALQDITLDMGPTIWLPKTHCVTAHERFQSIRVECMLDSPESPKDRLLRTTPCVVGILPKGSCVLFDSRLLHCGGANSSNSSRALLYVSFKHPNVRYPGNVGSIGYGLKEASLPWHELCNRILMVDGNSARLDQLSAYP